jgi:TatD DNase family protein
MIELIDTHAHLDFPDYDSDRGEVIAAAKEAGITRMVTIGTSLESQTKNKELVSQFTGVYRAVGLHPEHADEYEGEKTLAQLLEWASGEKVVAIGEIGLDFSRGPSDEEKKRQTELFIAQLKLALAMHLPVSIHSRAAEEEVTHIIREQVSGRPFQGGIAHCFGGTLKQAEELLELGFVVAISGIVTFKNADSVQALATHLPLGKLVLETDAPFLSPDRGKRNEPSQIRTIAEKVAELRNISLAEVAHQTTVNAEEILNV